MLENTRDAEPVSTPSCATLALPSKPVVCASNALDSWLPSSGLTLPIAAAPAPTQEPIDSRFPLSVQHVAAHSSASGGVKQVLNTYRSRVMRLATGSHSEGLHPNEKVQYAEQCTELCKRTCVTYQSMHQRIWRAVQTHRVALCKPGRVASKDAVLIAQCEGTSVSEDVFALWAGAVVPVRLEVFAVNTHPTHRAGQRLAAH